MSLRSWWNRLRGKTMRVVVTHDRPCVVTVKASHPMDIADAGRLVGAIRTVFPGVTVEFECDIFRSPDTTDKVGGGA